MICAFVIISPMHITYFNHILPFTAFHSLLLVSSLTHTALGILPSLVVVYVLDGAHFDG